MTKKRRYSRFEEGLMAAAYHLDYTGEDKLRDEVLRLQGLTVDDLYCEYPAERTSDV